MSALPAPQPTSDQSSRQRNPRLVDALLSQVEIQQQADYLEKRCRQAIAWGAHLTHFYWLTESDREVEIWVYYLPEDTPQIVAVEAALVDGREPTPLEYVKFTEEFDAAMDDFGDLWLRVVSAIVDR